MKFWLITLFETIPSDENRPTRFMEIADNLIAHGHKVTLWTSTFFHAIKAHRFSEDTEYEVKSGYHVICLKSWGYKKNISLMRIFAHRHFMNRLKKRIQKEERPDAILVALPPLSVADTITLYAVRNKIPVIVDIIDPWPDAFLTIVPQQFRSIFKFVLGPVYSQTKRILLRATGISAIGEKYLEWSEKYTSGQVKKCAVFYPAVNIDAYDQKVKEFGHIEKKHYEPPYLFVYAGGLGAAYDVETIVECARLLESDGYEKAKFIIAGSGPKYDFLVKSAKGLNNVEITGFLGAGDLARLYAKSHVGIACYSNRATQAVTYKFFDYMGAGLCIINSLQGEMSNIIERENVGYNYLANNPQELVNIVRFLCENTNVIKITGENARKYTEAKGDSKHVYSEMTEFLTSFGNMK